MFSTVCYVAHLQDTVIHMLRKYSLSADEVYIKSLLSDLSRKGVDLQSSFKTHISNNPNTSTNDSRIIEIKVHRTRRVAEWNMGKYFKELGYELATHYNSKNLEVPTRMSNHLLCGALETKDCTKSLLDINKLPLKPIKPYLNQSQTPTESIDLLHRWFKELKLNELVRVPPSSANLAAYVPNCFTLSQLVKLGVDISKIEAIPGVANMLIRLDFHNDIKPLLWKLSDFGFKPEQISRIITRFPKILKLPLCELSSRLAYFTDRNILPTDVVTIISEIPNILEKPSVEVDKSLGQIKSLLKLKNSEVAGLITREPKIIVHSLPKIKDIFVVLSKMIGFSQSTIRKLVLASPKLLVTEHEHLTDNFNIMHWRLNLSVDHIQMWPEALSAIPHLLNQRCTFLVRRKLFQPDPSKPLYTPLSAIILQNDNEFCQKYGFTTERDYDNFLRTL